MNFAPRAFVGAIHDEDSKARPTPGNRRFREAQGRAGEKLRAFVEASRVKNKAGGDFEKFERELHARVMEVERELLASELATYDLDEPAIVIEGRVHRRVLRRSQTYMTAAGEVTVERSLYKDRTDPQSRCVSPMEVQTGIVAGFWTPEAAKQALWLVTQMTPKKAAELFERTGNMAPSKSSIDRLPKTLSEQWEGNRQDFERALREGTVLPEGTVSVTISLDGVLAPIDGGKSRKEAEAAAAREERITKGPAGYREVGCATLAFCDAEGEMLGAIRMARSPETKKRTLKEMLSVELKAILAVHPDLKLVKVADGAMDNWDFLESEVLPPGESVIDFFHASEHLHAALTLAYGEGTRKTRLRHEELREALRDDDDGVEKVIRSLAYLVGKHPQKKKLKQELTYFRRNRKRMDYARVKAQGLMIGSGVVEATCKTLVAQRLKQSGMRWTSSGAQAILTARGWDQSDRFDEAWALLSATFRSEVTILNNVVELKPGNRTSKSASR